MGDQLMFIFKRVYGYAYGKQRRTRALLPLILFAALLLGQMAQAASGKLIDLDFKNSDLKDILRALASQAGVTFVIDNDVTGTVTLHLSKVTFGQALEILAKNNQLTYTVDNKVYHISQIDTSVLKVEYDAAAGLLTVEAERVKLFRLFETLSQKTGVNLVPAPELQDRIDIQLERAPLTDGIQAILTKANCIGETIGKVTYVRKKATELYPFTINYQNNLITIDAQNIPVSAVTRAITEKTGVAVVADPGVNSNVSIYIQNLPLAEALPPNGARRHYGRGTLETTSEGSVVRPIAETDSGHTSSLGPAQALVIQPENSPALPKGSLVDVIPLPGLF